jgi:hypothetical protein
MGTNLKIHQQGHDHPDSKVRGPFKTWELAPNYTFGKHIQDPCQNFSQKDLRIPPSHDQTKPNRFRKRRNILNNNFLAQEALVWAAENGQDLVLLFFDFEKAFDRNEWGFLFPTLSKLGFYPTWIQWISSLYWLASSLVKVNGEPGKDFRLARSVK